ncbi:MAG: hypothetical protein KDE14_16365 [Rhodobacteraceae bacterium]|nr:hypothetical protein [Paracoccaceae bacterium]
MKIRMRLALIAVFLICAAPEARAQLSEDGGYADLLSAQAIGKDLPSFDKTIVFNFSPYPTWLLRTLAFFGNSESRAQLGFRQIGGLHAALDKCTGVRNLWLAAREDNKFAVYWLLSHYMSSSEPPNYIEGLKWQLRWAALEDWTDEDIARAAQVFELPEDRKNEIIATYRTRSPALDPLPEPESCPALDANGNPLIFRPD